MTVAVLSIGSNIGDRLAHLQSVVDGLGSRVRAVSGVYRTAPWGGVEQQDFLNAVVIAEDPELDPIGWLLLGRQLETAAQRHRDLRWGPRTLDVDVITCGAEIRADPELTLPHPRAHERAFVLVPWLDVDPDATLAVAGATRRVRDLLAELDSAERDGVHRTESVLRT
ncbi:2-amino-4-hydroxy-6-hydroxymethyldihydropteridine diphosphokinase [Aldersonia sp. NBC_00410]|uniref:2-amino-4-hydroxy-6- hydroxymethyldihydropteridine diphosphokinase n=1 Tax=Aldersonia sp. NBC_00410 TaxID=2975954 RepID=UPI0022585057|nr:2-amino-4-hydroxy-6-hydroxymethyldihydropteridine diphosphokinase [Aldersonia sp. NBC_00410]MCX5043227.1 2-amino-4-hydroxy-6-hydroxymethyldihydropteridine diphosphokinase [Aldersonia sp. NBC_00410]